MLLTNNLVTNQTYNKKKTFGSTLQGEVMPLLLILLSVLPLVSQPQSPVNRRPEDRVSPPLVIHKLDPQYTDAARAAGIQGTVVLQATIDVDGAPHVVRVVRSLGFGLDENAIAAVEQWRF